RTCWPAGESPRRSRWPRSRAVVALVSRVGSVGVVALVGSVDLLGRVDRLLVDRLLVDPAG
ncbi:hypothetical protein ACFQ1S_05265, partial [Kibdelosporangium lantanae]